jgi:hypothetical protein
LDQIFFDQCDQIGEAKNCGVTMMASSLFFGHPRRYLLSVFETFAEKRFFLQQVKRMILV